MTPATKSRVQRLDHEAFVIEKALTPGQEVIQGEGTVVLQPTGWAGKPAGRVTGHLSSPSVLRSVIGAVVGEPIYFPEAASRHHRYVHGEDAASFEGFLAQVDQAATHWNADVVVELPIFAEVD
jgi:hypothetical protein